MYVASPTCYLFTYQTVHFYTFCKCQIVFLHKLQTAFATKQRLARIALCIIASYLLIGGDREDGKKMERYASSSSSPIVRTNKDLWPVPLKNYFLKLWIISTLKLHGRGMNPSRAQESTTKKNGNKHSSLKVDSNLRSQCQIPSLQTRRSLEE
jgi:hypothetical protein